MSKQTCPHCHLPIDVGKMQSQHMHAKMTKEQRIERAKKASNARWAKTKNEN